MSNRGQFAWKILFFCLLVAANAGAAVIPFAFTGATAGGTLTGTITIDNTAGTITSVNFTVTSPALTCSGAPDYQGSGGSAGWYFGITCTAPPTLVQITLETPLQPGGSLVNYAGGNVNVTAPNASYVGATTNPLVSGSLSSVSPPTLTKAFVPPAIVVGTVSTLTFTINNPNGAAATGINFSDPLPANVLISNPNGLDIGTCTGATISAAAGASSISVTNLSLNANSSCQFSVSVTGMAVGQLTNTTSAIASVEGGSGPGASAPIAVASGEAFQVRYTANLNVADSLVNITNTGANGAMPFGPGIGPQAGNICVNVYAFSPDEQLVGCCSCLVTPNGLVSLSVYNDIRTVTLTGLTPNSMMIKLVSTGAGPTYSGSSCNQSAALAGTAAFPLTQGMAAWASTAHIPGALPVPGAPAPFAITETRFTPATLSPGELASINNRCTAIIGNGSTYGTCHSCQLGGRGAARQ